MENLTKADSWNTYAGGCSVPSGIYSYSATVPRIGKYFIEPVIWSNGKLRGYTPIITNIFGELPLRGLWQAIQADGTIGQGSILTLTDARLACQKHLRSASSYLKNKNDGCLK